MTLDEYRKLAPGTKLLVRMPSGWVFHAISGNLWSGDGPSPCLRFDGRAYFGQPAAPTFFKEFIDRTCPIDAQNVVRVELEPLN